MTFPVADFNRVWVRGRIVGLEKMALGFSAFGVTQDVIFTPNVKPPVLISAATNHVIAAQPFAVRPAEADGYFAVQVPCTDDPDINPTDWTYTVTEPTGRTYPIEVSINTPILDAPGDPLDGQRVIDLVDIVPVAEPSGGTVQLVSGRGIASMTVDGTNHLIITYSDLQTQDAGVIPVGVTDHGDLSGLADDDHPQYHTNARGDARYAGLVHTHDDRYYTIGEVDSALVDKADASALAAKADDSVVVKLTGAQTVAGAKSFSTTPSTTEAAPSAVSHLTRKDYVDALVATKADIAIAANTQTGTAYTLVLADAAKAVEMNNAAANTLTIPPNSAVAFPVGTVVEVLQLGAGQTTIAAGAGVTLRAPNGAKLASQYATASLRKRATDEWILAGDVVV